MRGWRRRIDGFCVLVWGWWIDEVEMRRVLDGLGRLRLIGGFSARARFGWFPVSEEQEEERDIGGYEPDGECREDEGGNDGDGDEECVGCVVGW